MYSERYLSPLRIPEPEVHTNGVTAYAFEDEDSYSPRSELLSSARRPPYPQIQTASALTPTNPNKRTPPLLSSANTRPTAARALENASVRIDARHNARPKRNASRGRPSSTFGSRGTRGNGQTEASRARDELAMYRVQVANAQREIDRRKRSSGASSDSAMMPERAAGTRSKHCSEAHARGCSQKLRGRRGASSVFRRSATSTRGGCAIPLAGAAATISAVVAPPTETEEEGPYSDDYDYEYYGDEYDYDAAYAARHTPRNRAADETLPSSPGGMPMRTVDVGPISPETSAFGQPQPSPHPLSPPRTRMSFPDGGGRPLSR
ncbi:hypothetical protein BD626DRAFT_636062 [Schizophyllum amplum]|uniref:Uncharacterized protein n=1 Tax=Schizophyllum amplum TaxID=97359 RepID=A0A550BU62_9AGAR|nr:hypothetical protein BD626DRAFT_636062 [Auriculariopsis ampla]